MCSPIQRTFCSGGNQMARPDGKRKKRQKPNLNEEEKIAYTPRRDWSKIALYVFSVSIVLSMVCSLFIYIIPI